MTPTPDEQIAAMHRLKTWPEFYSAIESGAKTFEARKNDRDFKVGDSLCLQEWHPTEGRYTGREMVGTVTYILHGPAFGVANGFCIMGIGRSIMTKQIAALTTQRDALREELKALAQMGAKHGWNGTENSKFLYQFFDDGLTERDVLKAHVLKNEADMRTYHIALNDAAWTLMTVKNILPTTSLILPMVEASINLTPEKAIALGKEFDALKSDKERLDWVEMQTDNSNWTARQSSTGRGFRLHNTGSPHVPWGNSHHTARAAIDAAREQTK